MPLEPNSTSPPPCSPHVKKGGAEGIASAVRRRSVFLAWLLTSVASVGADWPTYRGDNRRSGSTVESLPIPLTRLWAHQPSQAPAPAWPPPARSSIWQRLQQLQPRVADDRTSHPIIAGDRVFIASSSEDHVACYDARTGQRLWRFFTEGPVRYAPTWSEGHVYFGSDDGWIYCLRAEDGSVRWRERVSPEDRRIPGNGRLISAWPIRTGVLVENGTAYCLAGLFPSQGVYVAAYRASDGQRLYRSTLNESPEGYLLGGREELYVPTGRGTPIAIDTKTGTLIRQYSSINGTFALVVQDQLVGRVSDSGSLDLFRTSEKLSIAHFPGRQMVVSGDVSYLLGDRELAAVDRARLVRLTTESKALERQLGAERKRLAGLSPDSNEAKAAQETVRASSKRLDLVQSELNNCELWRTSSTNWQVMLLAGNHLFLGGSGKIGAADRATGKLVWETEIPGRTLGLAAANGRLYASTDAGDLHVFGATTAIVTTNPGQNQVANPPRPSRVPSAATDPVSSEWIRQLHARPETRQGHAVVIGAHLESIARILASSTELQVTLIDRSPEIVRALREQLTDEGRYGPRLHVLLGSDDTLPFTDGFANVVIASPPGGPVAPVLWRDAELKRILRPFGGIAWLTSTAEPYRAPADPLAGSWTHLYANPANTSSTEDASIHADLALQWFGGPGPQSMTDRHLRATAPLVSEGRMIVVGENQLLGIDAFNGTLWWHRAMPGLTRYSIPYDSGYVAMDGSSVFAAVQGQLWQLDSATGETVLRLDPPQSPGAKPSDWGYVGILGDRIFGTTQRTNAARREATYKAVDDAYLNRQPMVTSDQVFALDRTSGRVLWTRAKGAIVNATLTLTEDSASFFESRNPAILARAGERIGLRELTAAQFHLVHLDIATGIPRWEQAMDLKECENILYLAASKDGLVVVGSGINSSNDALYHVKVLDRATGRERWRASHANGKQGELGHGEQVHHPVILGDLLVTEPVFYDLASGNPFNPDGQPGHWPIVRPGHSCGTMSGAGRALFFRANNPTVLNLEKEVPGNSRFTRLAPSRPGCWINIIPANGLVLIPEASAGCVCNYSLQTSMVFRPRARPAAKP